MAGSPSTAAVWGGADVLIAPIGTALPVGNAAFGAARVPSGDSIPATLTRSRTDSRSLAVSRR